MDDVEGNYEELNIKKMFVETSINGHCAQGVWHSFNNNLIDIVVVTFLIKIFAGDVLWKNC